MTSTGPFPVRLDRWTDERGVTRPVLVWSAPTSSGWRSVSTGLVGGGIGSRSWWVNAQVDKEYFHPDPAAHAVEIAESLGVVRPPLDRNGHDLEAGRLGVAMLTAADVSRFTTASDGGVDVVATVGLGLPVPAAASDEEQARETYRTNTYRPGTINVLVVVPVPMSDAALVNAVVTVTEAKTQALIEAGVPGTGTSSDAVCVMCPAVPSAQPRIGSTDAVAVSCDVEPYGGPRSTWGSRLARAVHAAVAEGTVDWLERHPPGDPHRAWPSERESSS